MRMVKLPLWVTCYLYCIMMTQTTVIVVSIRHINASFVPSFLLFIYCLTLI